MNLGSIVGNNRWWILSAAVLVATSFAVGISGIFQLIPIVEIHWPKQVTEIGYVPSYAEASDKELVMVFMGSSTCAFSNHDALPPLIEDAKLKLQSKSIDQGWSFSVIGVSVDWRASDGITHLGKFGHFDEIMTGRKWHGTAADLYSRKIISGIRATPQIFVFARDYTQNSEEVKESVPKEIPIHRVAGIGQIENWLNRGLPLPQDALRRFSGTDGAP
ncbi:MAG: hypothetical protein F4065_11415 [Rhodothermaceae bacterium]|nr:hypothetical protein [Rhodothermaceae bacterium]MXW32134.1 hypothetical protein [Rhodothermaceae bacterium]MXX96923.1 hypothetical protein [Rhodothermaceae bacterium]MXZ16766.1 hypothetical protein [Rhodothermaceae bacterium]MXZ57880.1 hypothetical protein [Rhodothermaceae bacterium]